MTINFYLNNDPKSSNSEKVIFAYIRGLSKGKTIVLHTGERIEPKHWSAEKQTVKRSYIGSPELNTFLINYKEEIKKTIRNIKADNINISFDEMKDAIATKFKKNEIENGFFDYFDLFLDMRKNELSSATIRKYKVLKNHLLGYEKYSKTNINFNNVNLMFYDKFSNYLQIEKKHINNTVSKNIDLFKTFIKWTIDRDINPNIKNIKFKLKTEKTDTVYLTESELMQLYELDLTENPALAKVRDVFCFSCFTGQRFSDVSHLKRTDINDKYWNLRVTKTKDSLKIPLTEYVLNILTKYADEDKPLPVISGQKTNLHLKELCKLAGFEDQISIVQYKGAEKIETIYPKYELITTHTARRTFVTLSLEKGMRPETLMEITGHKDYKTFKKYIKITDTVKSKEINKIWNIKQNVNIINFTNN